MNFYQELNYISDIHKYNPWLLFVWTVTCILLSGSCVLYVQPVAIESP